jgi:hypothetical protein
MINRYFLFIFLVLVSFGCGDDKDPEQEMETDCQGNLAAVIDGTAVSFGAPFSASLVSLNLDAGSELLVFWMGDNKALTFQVLIEESDVACFPEGRIELKDLPSNIGLLSFQYTGGISTLSSVSNIFLEDGGDGWLDIKSCDGENDIISVEFEFDAVTTNGELVQVRGGGAEDICFKRTK